MSTSLFIARLGVLQRLPGLSCKDIKDSNVDAATGEYWIDPTISNDEFTVFCDMQTDGGNYCILETKGLEEASCLGVSAEREMGEKP